MATTMRKTATEEDLLRTPKDGSTYELDGEDVLPGFRCRLNDILA
jgi:hypothetical protein